MGTHDQDRKGQITVLSQVQDSGLGTPEGGGLHTMRHETQCSACIHGLDSW
jgi:hypothetical protein